MKNSRVCPIVIAASGFFLAMGNAQASSTDELLVPAGGHVTIHVPTGTARTVALDLANVNDAHGRIGSFRLKAFRSGALVESHRTSVLEPGGHVRHVFNRPFDRLHIADAEGWVSATVKNVVFCEGKMNDDLTCVVAAGARPKPGMFAPKPPSQTAIANNAYAGSLGTFLGLSNDQKTNNNSSRSGAPDNNNVKSPGGNADSAPVPPKTGKPYGLGTLKRPMFGDPAPKEPSSKWPVFGEDTKISPMTRIAIQGGPQTNGNYLPYVPWIDQAKLSMSWNYMRYGRKKTGPDVTKLNDNGMPIFPVTHQPNAGLVMSGGTIWMGSGASGSDDLAGSWALRSDGLSALAPRMINGTIVSKKESEVVFACEAGVPCRLRIQLSSSSPNAKPLTMIRLTDASGKKVSDVEDHKAGLVTRSRWRKANYGYTDLRLLHESGANAVNTAIIRYDQIATSESASWSNQGFFVPFRMSRRQNPKQPWADLSNGTGMGSVYSPVPARLKAAWEIGAVYHHNFHHNFLEHRGDVDPTVIGQWAEDLWRRTDISDELKLSLFNDYELQHVDEFGADILANQKYLVNNQIKIEVGNETWNFSWPYNYGNGYFARKAKKNIQALGWGKLPKGVTHQAVQTGYNLTKTIARLRKKYPQVEWRGVMAVQTGGVSSWRSGSRPAPATPSGYYNKTLHGLVVGYELFWRDYTRNEDKWAELYAKEPTQPGDWFEAHGTTYYGLTAKRDDMKTHLAGIAPDELSLRAENKDEWPALRKEILEFFINSTENRGSLNGRRGMKTGTSSLYHLRRNFVALNQHAEALGMQTASYEGGSHADMGTYYRKWRETPPHLVKFWRNFHDSMENALVQAAVHDAAIDAGWMGLADYQLFQGHDANYIFGTRKHFEDITPRYCEYARWMSRDAEIPQGIDAAELVHPQDRCGGMIDYLQQAKANGYYVGREIPEASSFLK